MSDGDALFQAILAAPDDDAPRLVYADWLDEAGDPDRAEFVRVQCRLARLPFYEPDHPGLRDRAAELYVRHMAEWQFDWLPPRQVFRRGFVEEVTLRADLFARHARALFEQTPLGAVHFTDGPRYPSWRWDPVAALQGVGFAGEPWGPAEDALGRGLEWPRLKWFRAANAPASAQFLRALGRPALEALELAAPNFGGFDPASIFVTADLRTIRTLRYDVPDDTPYSDRLRARGVRILVEAGLPLRRLDLGGQAVGDAGLSHLSRSADLEELSLARNEVGQIGTTGVEDLCASPHLTGLRVLDLSANPLGPAGVRELAAWPGLRRLRWLDLSNCGLTAAAGRPLAESQYLHDGLGLRLDGNDFDPAALFPRALLRRPAPVC